MTVFEILYVFEIFLLSIPYTPHSYFSYFLAPWSFLLNHFSSTVSFLWFFLYIDKTLRFKLQSSLLYVYTFGDYSQSLGFKYYSYAQKSQLKSLVQTLPLNSRSLWLTAYNISSLVCVLDISNQKKKKNLFLVALIKQILNYSYNLFLL